MSIEKKLGEFLNFATVEKENRNCKRIEVWHCLSAPIDNLQLDAFSPTVSHKSEVKKILIDFLELVSLLILVIKKLYPNPRPPTMYIN